MKNILLLGGTGFIGQAMAHELLVNNSSAKTTLLGGSFSSNYGDCSKSSRISVMRQRVNSETDFRKMVSGVDVVVHLISSTVPIASGLNYKQEMEDISLTAGLLDACVKEGVKKFIYVSSAGSIYGNAQIVPTTENDPCAPLSLYAYQKLAIENLIELFGRMHSLNYCIARLSNPFGPGQNPRKGQGVVSTFLYRALRGETLEIRGDGSASRDYIFISDAAKALCNLAIHNTKYSTYNIGSGECRSILDIINCIGRVTGRSLDLLFRPATEIELSSSSISVQRYIDEFGEINSVSFADGVMRTMNYIEGLLASSGV